MWLSFTEMTEKEEFQPKAGRFPVSGAESYKRLDRWRDRQS